MNKNNKRDNKIKKLQKGFALVEVIAALGVSALVITALISLSISTLRTSLDSELLLEGTKMANREVELVRAYRDGYEGTDLPRSWETFVTGVAVCIADTPCHMDTTNGTPLSGSSTEPPTGAKAVTRSFTVTDIEGNAISDPFNPPSVVRVSVSVTWKVGDQEKGSYIYTDLSNWRGR